LEPDYAFNMTGFQRVADAIMDVTLASGDIVPVVAVPLYVLLKLVAFTDRHLQKDIDGVLHCVRNYAETNDRRFGLEHEGTAVPYEYGSAYLLGVDGRVFVDEQLAELIAPVIERFVPPDIDLDNDESYREKENQHYLRWFRAGLGI